MNETKATANGITNGHKGAVAAKQFTGQLQAIQERLDALHHDEPVGHLDDRQKLEEAIETLQITLEELRVSNEMLQIQNEELATAQEALRSEQQRFRLFFDNTPLACFVTNREGIIQEVNRATTILFGAAEETLIGSPLDIFIPKDERPEFRARLGQLGQKGQAESWSLRLLRNRQTVYAKASVFVQRPSGRGPMALQWLVHNVTLQPAAEARA